jgi:hypothetical protein
VIIVVARDPGEFERALYHSEWRIAIAIQNPIRKRTMICPDPHSDPSLFAKIDKGRKTFSYSRQFCRILLIGVFADHELLRIGIIPRIDSYLIDPFRCFHGGFGLEMNVRDDRHIAAAVAQTFYNVLEIARVFNGRRGDPDNFATGGSKLHRLLDRHFRVHRVARDHRLDPDRICATDADVADHHLTGDAAIIIKRISAVIHETANLQNPGQARNAVRLMQRFPGALAPVAVPRRVVRLK